MIRQRALTYSSLSFLRALRVALLLAISIAWLLAARQAEAQTESRVSASASQNQVVEAERREDAAATSSDGSESAEAAPAATDTPLPGPKYSVLRFQEDYSYLDGPEGSYQSDFFDPIKNIHLDDDWRLSIGGSLRGRLEFRTNKFLNPPDPTQDTAFLHRYFLHADLKYRKLFRLYVEGTWAAIEDNDGPQLAIDENTGDLYQYFADVRFLGEEVPLTLRAGRQELLYGKQRLFSPLDWANSRRRFEGFKLFWQDENWNADLFYVFPVRTWRSRFDEYDSRQPVFGTYVTYKGIPDHGIDAYYFYSRNANEPTNAEGSVGSLNLNTLGTRFWGKTGPWDYDTELTGQFGSFAGDNVQAWAWAAEGGYTFSDCPWTPRFGAGFDYASGDSDPNDGQHARFNQLFPLGHAYLGYMDLVARQNVIAGNLNVTAKPCKNVTTRVAYHTFWLAENSDGLFNAGGVQLRRDATGSSPHDVGQEVDFTVGFKLDKHSSFLVGYSHFWNGGFINSTGLGDDADFVYVQYLLRF
jgi:hypothetical protein